MSSKGISDSRHDILTKLFSSPIDARIQHMNRILSTATGIDATFCFLGYGLVFVSSQLQLFSEVLPNFSSQKVTSDQSIPAAVIRTRLLELAASSKALGGICSDVRTFMRLWGLLRIYLGMKATYLRPPHDSVLHALSWAQLSAMAAYLAYENQVYLASKGVIKSMSPATMGSKLRTAIWIFAGYLVLDFARLWRVWQLQVSAKSDVVDKSGAIAKREEEDRLWYKSLTVDLSYFPLCFHWGIAGGILPPRWADMVVGALGLCAGLANFREAARASV